MSDFFHIPSFPVSALDSLRRAAFHILLLLVLLLPACADDPLLNGVDCPEGEEATITLGLSLSDPADVTRGDIAAGLDRQVRSLWIGIYNVASGELTTSLVFPDLNDELNHTFKNISINTLSGKSYIVGVANYNYRYASESGDSSGSESIEAALAAADTWEKFLKIAAYFDTRAGINIEAPLNALLMSGSYTEGSHSDGSRTSITPVNIKPGKSTLPGAIHLRRLISHVKFNVKYDAKNIKSFNIRSWQVINIPSSSWLFEHDDSTPPLNSVDAVEGSAFCNSAAMSDVSVNGSTSSFDFWQLENKRSGRPLPAGYTNTNAYSYRDKEYKNSDGSNTGKFSSLVASAGDDDINNLATYVILKAEMEMNVDENGYSLGGKKRLVNTDYVVHLGYCEGSSNMQKALDFNCRRNTEYTYNVTIRNIGDLLVEVKGEEKNPAVEGFVSDITDSYYNVDAHYAAVNIRLTDDDIRDFHYYIDAPRLDGGNIIINSMDAASIPPAGSSDRIYMDWIELRPTSSQSVLADYKPVSGTYSDGKTLRLDEIRTKASKGWYTLFINEYVYETGKYADGNESGSTAWHNYVGLPDRRVWLNVSGNVSPDGESIHYVSKYAVSQASIQSYYDSNSPSGLGVEHTNESLGLNLRNSFNPNNSGSAGRNSQSGRFNLAQFIAGSTGSSLSWTDDSKSWSSFVKTTTPQTINAVNNQNVVLAARTATSNPVPLPQIVTVSGSVESITSSIAAYDPDQTTNPKYIQAITACLNRNRDLDGDGRISANELRWFVPTTAQYTRMILGRRSLEQPVFDPSGISRLPNNSGTNNGFNSSMLAYASDGKMIWLMEGTSNSQWREWPASCAAPWEVRCVRNLGGNMTIINKDNVTQPAFELRKGTNIVDLKYYEAKSIREEPYYSSSYPMPPHHINDQRYNRCYKSFEFFDSVLTLNDNRLQLYGKSIEWASYLKSTNPCKVLDYTGKTGWRVPNQKELAILGILGVLSRNAPSGNTFQISCSFSYFDFDGYVPGKNPKDPDGTVSEKYRFAMKGLTSSGQLTQSEKLDGQTIYNNYFGIRCVRDVR